MHQRILSWVLIGFAAVLAPARQSLGWIATGHIVTALVAWEDLTPKTKAAVTALLKKHPRYQKDLLQDLPDGATPDEIDRFAFAKAATWPDMVRLQTNPMHTLYSHPSWHFIDIPFGDGAPVFAPVSDQPGPHNIVEALKKCSTGMKDPSLSPAERAIDICWVEHLVGDIHQPLHAASLYSPEHPQGDKGGNDEEVLRDPPYPNSICYGILSPASSIRR